MEESACAITALTGVPAPPAPQQRPAEAAPSAARAPTRRRAGVGMFGARAPAAGCHCGAATAKVENACARAPCCSCGQKTSPRSTGDSRAAGPAARPADRGPRNSCKSSAARAPCSIRVRRRRRPQGKPDGDGALVLAWDGDPWKPPRRSWKPPCHSASASAAATAPRRPSDCPNAPLPSLSPHVPSSPSSSSSSTMTALFWRRHDGGGGDGETTLWRRGRTGAALTRCIFAVAARRARELRADTAARVELDRLCAAAATRHGFGAVGRWWSKCARRLQGPPAAAGTAVTPAKTPRSRALAPLCGEFDRGAPAWRRAQPSAARRRR